VQSPLDRSGEEEQEETEVVDRRDEHPDEGRDGERPVVTRDSHGRFDRVSVPLRRGGGRSQTSTVNTDRQAEFAVMVPMYVAITTKLSTKAPNWAACSAGTAARSMFRAGLPSTSTRGRTSRVSAMATTASTKVIRRSSPRSVRTAGG
jgi:hypothetical protein